jgi:PKD repeat protein
MVALSGSVSPQQGVVSWQAPIVLENGMTYYWRVRAFDGINYSSWMQERLFSVSFEQTNIPPSTPLAVSPIDSVTVAQIPVELIWNNSQDPDNDVLSYHVQLKGSTGAVIEEVLSVTEGADTVTKYSVSTALTNNAWYSWCVRAFDGNVHSSWSQSALFYLDTLFGANQPPETPALVEPGDFDTLTSVHISLSAGSTSDPEGDPLVYEFKLLENSVNGPLVASASNMTPLSAGSDIIWQVSPELKQGQQYFWSCRAFDGDKYSEWAAYRTFWISPPVLPPVADFAADKTSGLDSLTVNFSDLSINDPISWLWDFGDGGTAAHQNPQHTYTEAGTFSVSLTVVNSSGSDMVIKVDYINIAQSLSYWQAFAESELSLKGTVSGDYLYTTEDDGASECITEVNSRSHLWKSYSMMDHRWFFTVQPNKYINFFVEAYRPVSVDGDDFLFEYSTDDSIFTPLVIVNSEREYTYSAPMPEYFSGPVTIRIRDTDRTKEHKSLDAICIDYMYIESSDSPPPPDTIFVRAIEVRLIGGKAKKHMAQATIAIQNQDDVPVVGATVSGHFTGPSEGHATGKTGSDGAAVFLSPRVGKVEGRWQFHIDNVSKGNDIYVPERNAQNYGLGKSMTISEPVVLEQNSPNPFNPVTNIGFAIAEDTEIKLAVYNVIGQEVALLLDEYLEAGYHSVEWDSRDDNGTRVASGIYFYRVQAESFTATRKMLLLK